MRPELQDLVDEAARLLDAPVTLEDRDFQLVAFAAHPGPVDAVRHASILQRRSSAEVRAHFESFGIAVASGPVHVPGAGAGRTRIAPRLCLPARSRGVTYGYLWAVEDGTATDDDRATAAMRLADRAAAALAQQARARDDVARLLDDLLSADVEAAVRAADELDARGLALRGRPVTVVEVVERVQAGERVQAVERAQAGERVGGPVDPAAVRASTGPVNLWGLPRSVLARTHDTGLTLVVPSAGGRFDAVEAAGRALHLLAAASGRPGAAVAGVGDPVPDPARGRESLRQARVAARVASARTPPTPVATWSALGVHRLLGCGAGALEEAALDPAVRRLLEAGDDDLVRTALTWLDAACSPARAAAALAVHRQTLYQRLARVEQLTGMALTGAGADGRDRMRLHLALSLAPLLAPQGRG